MDQIVNVYKPAGITSYDVVRQVKKILPGVKVGHGGTLDPFAEGVLLILLGKATRRMVQLQQLPKTYHALLRLGAATTSGDYTTEVVQQMPVPAINAATLAAVARQFQGAQQQIPPIYSAKKIKGCPAYRLARRGLTPTLQPVTVTIYALELKLRDPITVEIKVTCSAGTYIRRLGEDIAQALGTCGHLISLQRIRIGDYDLQDAIPVDQLARLLPDLQPEVVVQ